MVRRERCQLGVECGEIRQQVSEAGGRLTNRRGPASRGPWHSQGSLGASTEGPPALT